MAGNAGHARTRGHRADLRARLRAQCCGFTSAAQGFWSFAHGAKRPFSQIRIKEDAGFLMEPAQQLAGGWN